MWFTLQKTYPKRAEDGLFFPKEGGCQMISCVSTLHAQLHIQSRSHQILPVFPITLVLAISTCQVSSNSSRVMPPEQSLSMIEKIWHLCWITAATLQGKTVRVKSADSQNEGRGPENSESSRKHNYTLRDIKYIHIHPHQMKRSSSNCQTPNASQGTNAHECRWLHVKWLRCRDPWTTLPWRCCKRRQSWGKRWMKLSSELPPDSAEKLGWRKQQQR